MDQTLTVITYVAPGEKHLQRCIQGLEEQNVSFKWMILCYEVPESVETKIELDYILLPDTCKNKASAYNFVLPQIDSKYIAYNDADDISLPHRFERQLQFLDKNREIDILGGQLIINENIEGWEVYENDAEIKAFMLLNNPMVNSTIMLRNKPNFWGAKVKYNEHYQRAEDYEFWLNCIKQKLNFANLAEPLISYLQDTNRPEDLVQLREASQTRENTFEFYANAPISESLKKDYHQFANKKELESAQKTKVQENLLAIYPNEIVIRKILKKHQTNKNWLQSLRRLFS